MNTTYINKRITDRKRGMRTGTWWLARLLPPLPHDIVDHIWHLGFPRPFMKCSMCRCTTLQIDRMGILGMPTTYSIVNGLCYCSACLDGMKRALAFLDRVQPWP